MFPKQSLHLGSSYAFTFFQEAKFASVTCVSRVAKLENIHFPQKCSATVFPNLAKPLGFRVHIQKFYQCRQLSKQHHTNLLLNTFYLN